MDLHETLMWTTAQAAIEKAYHEGNLRVQVHGQEHEAESIYFDNTGKIGIRLLD